ncbi:acylphosphatase [Amnibacterium kyonggiense]|uniref:acylphosphatase n=1 Tax=Amnibacterium kyonggiense TaxID=595671 RepID=A0A4R7FL52_9MICO|nr:acylphosphatase [Amnibacterium kyonggiense]TDS77088.1 acylphosphatase [Amnibacterium kyonggiense]
MTIARRYTVTGAVQGVGFRWAAQGEAERLGVVGRVRNRTDGAVEILAQGERAAMDEFAAWLEQGPRFAKVADVDAEPVDGFDADSFEITR